MKHKLKMKDVIEDHKTAEKHFFDKETIDFWGSKIETELINNEFFITSEDNFDRTEKLYSIRRYNWDTHNIETVSFQQFKTLNTAMETLMEF